MISVTRYNELKQKADKAKADADKAEGALALQMKELKDKFGCESLEAAEKMLADLQQQESELATVCEERMTAFEQEWGDKLSGKLAEPDAFLADMHAKQLKAIK